MPARMRERRWTAAALSWTILGGCAETIPLEVVLFGVSRDHVEDVVVCVDEHELVGASALEDGATFEAGDRTGKIEVSARVKGEIWAWGSASFDGSGSVRVAVSRVRGSVLADPPEPIRDLVDPNVASLADDRVVVVGWDGSGQGGAWVWDVLGDDIEGPVPLAPRDAAFTATVIDESRVLIAGGSDPATLEIVDLDAGVVSVADESCVGRFATDRRGAAAILDQKSTGPSAVLLAGVADAHGVSSQAVVFDPGVTPQCEWLELSRAQADPMVVPLGPKRMVVFDGIEDDHDLVRADPDGDGWTVAEGRGAGRREGHAGIWLGPDTWILGGEDPAQEGRCAADPIVRLSPSQGQAPPPDPIGYRLDVLARRDHAVVPLSDRILVAGGTSCAPAEADEPEPEVLRDALVIGFDEAGNPVVEADTHGASIMMAPSFCHPSAVPIAPGSVLVVGTDCAPNEGAWRAVLVNPGPDPSSDSPCAVDRSLL